MVVKVLRDHDPDHLGKPLTVREFKRIMKEIVTAMVVFGVIMCVALALSLHNQRQIGRQTDAIQQSRYKLTLAGCEDSNDRNVKTKLELSRLQAPANRPAREVQQQIAATKLLIDRLAPYRPDCVAYARGRVKT